MGVEGEINKGRVEGCCRVEEGKEFIVLFFVVVFCPCVAAFCGEAFSRHGSVYLLLQHCLHWFITRDEEANTHTHKGGGGERQGRAKPSTNYQKEKI